MARDSLARLVGAVDKDRAGKFSGSVPNRSTTARQVCPACRQVPDYAAHRAAYEKPWRDAGWFVGLPRLGERERWVRVTKQTASSWEWADYVYERPEGCPSCGGELVSVEGW